jgi:hypothetical protein
MDLRLKREGYPLPESKRRLYSFPMSSFHTAGFLRM